MGGSGGSSIPSKFDLDAARRQILDELQRQEQDAAINAALGQLLAGYNDRDYAKVQERLSEITEVLAGATIDVERLLFGGSVAKHTYVDGLSDVDALVVINDQRVNPSNLVGQFRDALRQWLPQGDVQSIESGNLAVTVRYLDGSEVQLLPAVERNGHTSIASGDGGSWREIRPHKFAEKLTEVNARNNGAVVPTVKLAKAAIAQLPSSSQLSGYHIEAMAVDAFKDYGGRRDRRSMLLHLVEHASTTVMKPTGDITGQTVHIDKHLGAAGSTERASVSADLRRLAIKLRSAETSNEIRSLLFD